jgi:hypothetical protein
MKERPLPENERKASPAKTQAKAERDAQVKHVAPMQTAASTLGNAAFQRRIAQRSAAPAEVPDETTQRIHAARGGGQALEAAVQQKMGDALGADFSDVRVHTGEQSHSLNQELGALAFTTGKDVFFGENQYAPHSTSGQELIAHELTHVVQQSTGAVTGGAKMTVNAPGDRFEQEADAVAKAAVATGPTAEVQRQELDPEEELQAKLVQRQELPEEEALEL